MNKPEDIREILELYDLGELSTLEAKQAIEAHTKAEIAKVLDRLEQAIKDGGYEASYELCCVQAERNKLKERDDDQL